MRKFVSFLDDHGRREYEQLNKGVQRLIIEIPARPEDNNAKQKQPTDPQPLAPFIVDRVSELIDKHENRTKVSSERKWFGCACIEVKEDDGMTWSAETVNRELKESFPGINILHLANYKNSYSLPVISNLIGDRHFLRFAGEHRLGAIFIHSRRWMTPVILAAAILTLAIIKILENAQKASPTVSTYLTILTSAALVLISEYIINYLMDRTTSKKLESFNAELQKIMDGEDRPENYLQFVDSLAQALQTVKFPRFVIVDDYERLDETTKRVINSYFKKFAEQAEGAEYWVVFDGQDGEKFSDEIINGSKKNYGYNRSRIFQQLFIDEVEKRALVERLGIPQEALHYQAIKLICKDTSEGKERIKRLIEEHRLEHPKDSTYGELEFLYLLSLTASMPGDFFLEYEDLIARLAASSFVRADVLKQFLSGTKLAKHEFKQMLEAIEKSFPTTLITRKASFQKKLHVYLETTLALTERAKAFELPRPELGHLYWGLYWYDRSREQLEVSRIRKLNDHLRLAEPIKTDGADTDLRILKQLVDALMYATDKSLNNGLFEDITPLLKKAPALLELEELAGGSTMQKRLSRQCWEAYSVIGNDEILEVLIDLYSEPVKQTQAKGKPKKEDLLEKLFFESMPLPPAKRAMLMADFFSRTGGKRRTVDSISHYTRVRSAWLALSTSPILYSLDSTDLYQAVRQSDKAMEDLTRKALDRIDSESEESIRVTDIATLSLALWCNALRFSPMVRVITESNYSANFHALVDLATDAVLKASDIKDEATKSSEKFLKGDFLGGALARELYAVALVSIITANQYLIKQNIDIVDQPLLDKINDLLKFSDLIFSYPLPKLPTRQHLTSSNLLGKIDAMLKFCGIIWNRFGLHRLLEFINIRRVHFNAICMGVNYAREDAYEFVLESIGPVMNEEGFTGLVANLVVADCLREAGEMEAFYLRQAASIAIAGNFSPQLQNELSFAVVNEIHHLGYDIDFLLQHLLMEVDNQECYLLRLLRRPSEKPITDAVLALFNAIRPDSPPEIASRLEQVVASAVDNITSSKLKREAESLLNYFSIREKARTRESFNFQEILEFWKDRKEYPFYAGVLNLLMTSDSPPPEIWQESLLILDHDPRQDKMSTHISLALNLAQLNLQRGNSDTKDNGIVLRYLRAGIEKWKSFLSADTNLDIYRTLLQLDQEKASYYFSEVQKWAYIKFRRQQLERLPKLVEQGQFFLIFFDYVHTMLGWGLVTNTKREVFINYLNPTADEKTERLNEWLNSGAQVPRPLSGRVVSGEFTYLGYYLFSSPCDQDQDFQDARSFFNKAAYDFMSDLIDIIMELALLPVSIKELLQNYSKRFFYDSVTD